MTWVLDLDGVMWRGDTPIEGAADAVQRLRDGGERATFVTNNSAKAAADYVAALGAMGVPCVEDDVIHGGHAVARLVEPGSRVLCVAGSGVVEGVRQRGATAIAVDGVEGRTPPEVDAVIVAIRTDLDYRKLSLAVRAAMSCGTLLAPSGDPLYPVADGFDIGGGALARAVAFSAGVELQLAGKPNPPMTAVVRERVGEVSVVVGDQSSTDGGLARALDARFVLVHSGVTTAGHVHYDSDVVVHEEADDIGAAVRRWAAARS